MTSHTHCQICGRDIKAKNGKIAHHGYQRPQGWHEQTASCFGARWAPYEVSRLAIRAALRSNLQHRSHVLDMIEVYSTGVQDGKPLEKLTRPYTAPSAYQKHGKVRIFDKWGSSRQVVATEGNRFATRADEDFEPLMAAMLKQQQNQLRGLEAEFRYFADRWRNWKAPKD